MIRERRLLLVLWSALALVGVCLFPARAFGANLALVIGNNTSATLGRAELRYADDDAAKYAALLKSTAGDGDVELLTRMDVDTTRLFPAQARAVRAPTRAAVEAAIDRIVERARAAEKRGERVVFTFVFAGHGDVEDGRGFLELEDGRFFREDLEALLARVPAARAHVVIDACNSVYMLASRKPGGTRFATPEDVERSMRARLAHVGTFLSTSADAQVYEWSQIESGVFSHTVRSGLSGAADLDGDGRITYGELRAFVRIAAEGIPNPRFRPRLYARGPGGRDDEVVFEPRAAGARRRVELERGPERRVTVLDENAVPLVEARLEAGFAPHLWLPSSESKSFILVEREGHEPERRRELTLSDADGPLVARAEPGASSHEARGSARPFDLLFANAFGPRAAAEMPPDRAQDEVYGVSSEDRARMQQVLDAAAEMQHDRRLALGVGAGTAGLIFAGAGVVMLTIPDRLSRDPSATKSVGVAMLGLGAVGVGVGALNLFGKSELEERRDAFAAAVRARPEAFDRVVGDAERELLARADAQRRARNIASIGAMAAGGLALAGGVGLEVAGTSDEARVWGRLAMASGVGLGLAGLGIRALRSEEERVADLWKKQRAIEMPSSKLTLEPLVGLGTFGIGGAF